MTRFPILKAQAIPRIASLFGFCLAILALPALAREPTWTRLDSSHLTIISAVPEKETRAWAVHFEQFRTGIGRFIHTYETALRPVTLVLFRS
jgi:hypothetical protein